MKKWRPGTVEVDSYLVVYRKGGEKFGMYVQAEHDRDARQQVLKREQGADIGEVVRQEPTEEHIYMMMDEFNKEQING